MGPNPSGPEVGCRTGVTGKVQSTVPVTSAKTLCNNAIAFLAGSGNCIRGF